MNKLMLLGDEATAQAAIDSGISGIYGYPGTPSTEIIEYVQASDEAKRTLIRSEWSVNEKTALEESLGMAYAGKRAMVCMKHVGLNVAADPFINSAITGVNGGLVVVGSLIRISLAKGQLIVDLNIRAFTEGEKAGEKYRMSMS